MKRFLFLFFASLLSLATWAYDISDDSTGSTIYYNIIEGTTNLEVTFSGEKYSSVVTYSGEVDIPASVTSDGITYTVTGLVQYAFRKCTVTKITLPETITSLGSYSFDSCTSLESVNLPSGITEIPSRAFYDCEKLASIDIPAGVTKIDGSAFYQCYSLKAVVLPEGLTSLGSNAFDSCSALEEVNIPDGVTEIPTSAFSGCSSLKTISLPKGCTSLAKAALAGCTSLKTIYSYNPEPPSIGASTTFGNASKGYVDFETCILYVPAGCEAAYRAYVYTGDDEGAKIWNDFVNIVEMSDESSEGTPLEDGATFEYEGLYYKVTSSSEQEVEVTATEGSAYTGDIKIDEYIDYENVTYHVIGIGADAFKNATITSVDIPSSVGYIGNNAFGSCPLTSLVLPEGLKTIGTYSFYYSTLQSVSLPKTLASIGQYAFAECSSLTTVTFAEGSQLTSLGTYAFYDCKALTSISLPDELTEVPAYAFQSCTSLAEVTIGSKVTSIGTYSFRECAITSIEIPASVQTIGSSFYQCKSLESVTFADGSELTSIDGMAFYQCTALKSIVIPNKVTSIGRSAFQGCSSLEEVTIGEGVTSLGDGVFYQCYSLMTVTALPTTPPSTGSNVFEDDYTIAFGTLYVPCESKDVYSETSPWSGFLYIIGIDCVDETVKFEVDGIYYQTTSEEEVEVTYGGELWSKTSSYTGSITIPETVNYQDVTYKVIGIGEAAFYECASLSSISLPNSILYIDQYAFAYETSGESNSLTEIVIPESCTSIATYAFQYCTNLASVTLPSEITEIPTSAFDRTSLTSIEIPAGVTAIGANAFRACSLTDGVTCYAVEPPVCTVQTGLSKQTPFTSVSTSSITLYVPSGSEDAYREAEVWEDFGTIEAIDGGSAHGYSADDPFEVSEVIALAETLSSSDTVEGVYVKGIVSEIGSFYSSYGDLDYYISDDGTTDNQFYIYNGYYLDGEKFTSADQIKVTDTVIVTGNLTNYQGTTPELARGSKIVYLEEGEGVEGGSEGSVSASGTTLTLTNEGVTVGTETATIDFTTLGLSNAEDVSGRAFELSDGSTVTFAQNGGNNAPMYYTSGTAIRAYALNTATFSASKQIAKIEMTCVYTSGTYYTGNTTATVEFTETGAVYCNYYSQNSGGTQLRVQSLVVYYAEEETEGGGDHEYSIDPEEGVQTSLQKFTLYTPDGVCADEYGSSEYDFTVYLYKDGASEPYASTSDIDSKFDTSVTWNGDCELYFTFAEAITEAGEYEFVIPANSFYWVTDEGYNMELNDELRFSYTVEGGSEHEYSIDPEEGVQTSLQKFTLYTPDGVCADEYGSSEYDFTVYLYKDGASEPYASTSDIDSKFDTSVTWNGDCELYFTFAEAITEAGEYEFVIPANSFYWVTDEGYNMELNDELRFSYTIEESTWGTPEGYVLDPADESEVETLKTITIKYDGAGLTCADAVYAGTTGVVMSKTGQQVATVSFEDGWDDDLNLSYVIATLSEEISELGTYYVTFPEKVFMAWNDDFDMNPEFTVTYYVTGPTSTTGYTYDPEDGSTLGHLSEFTVYYSDGIDCSWNYSGEITVTDEDGNVVANDDDCETEYPADDPWGDGLYCTITLNATITAAGKYTVNIPEGYFVVGSNYLNSEALTITYYVDGSEAVEPGTFVCVVDPEDKSSLEQLAQVAFYNPTEDEEIFVNDELARDPEIYVYNEAGDVVTTISYFDTYFGNNGEEYTQIVVFEDVVTEGGTYTVSVPAEMFIIYDEDNRPYYSEAMTLTYTIVGTGTGIGGISINDENVEGIYSTSGQKLNSTVKGVNIIRYSDGSVKKLYVK